MQRLRNRKLYAKFSKYELWLDQMTFLRHIVLVNGILVDLSKVEVVLEWQSPKTAKKVWSFLGLVQY